KTTAARPWRRIKPSLDHPIVGAADFAAAFKDTPEVRKFLAYISTKAAGTIWVSTGAVNSPNKRVSTSAYPNVLVRAEAHQLATAKTFLFDGSDQLPGAFGDTWGFALQDVIQKPGNIKSILSDFQNKTKGQFEALSSRRPLHGAPPPPLPGEEQPPPTTPPSRRTGSACEGPAVRAAHSAEQPVGVSVRAAGSGRAGDLPDL